MPRFSVPILDKDGRQIGIACGSRRAQRCYLCGSKDAPLLCDGPACDKPICRKCSTRTAPNRDVCTTCTAKGHQ